MTVKELKEFLKDIPDDVVVCVSDMDCFYTYGVEPAHYEDGDTSIDLIMNVYIDKYTWED